MIHFLMCIGLRLSTALRFMQPGMKKSEMRMRTEFRMPDGQFIVSPCQKVTPALMPAVRGAPLSPMNPDGARRESNAKAVGT